MHAHCYTAIYVQLFCFTVSKSPSKEQELHAQVLSFSKTQLQVFMPLVSLQSEIPKFCFSPSTQVAQHPSQKQVVAIYTLLNCNSRHEAETTIIS